MCAVCLSVSLHLSVPGYLLEGQDSSKYAGINETMNDVLTCYKFHLLCLADTFKCKTKTKTKNKNKKWSCDFIERSTTRKSEDYNKAYALFHKMNTLQSAVSRCLNFCIRDILHSADPSRA